MKARATMSENDGSYGNTGKDKHSFRALCDLEIFFLL